MLEDKLVDEIRKHMRLAEETYRNTRVWQLDDLRFAAGSSDNQYQWPANVLTTRGGTAGSGINARPTLTINKLPQHIFQITNEQRQNRPSGRVIPANDGASVDVAEIYDGMIRHIGYMSNVDIVYDTACFNQVTHGEGFFRILTKYEDDTSFNQELIYSRVRNSFSVYMDPFMQDICGEDARWAAISSQMSKEEFERTWPDAKPVSSLLDIGTGDNSTNDWIRDEAVRIVEYFYYEYEDSKLNLYANDAISEQGTDQDKLNRMVFGKPVRSRKIEKKTVYWCKTNGFEILEKQIWPGKFIPIVRVIGNEYEIDGEILISGIVRNAKDAQRMYNYWCSQEAEMLALAPKAPFIGYGGQFEGYEVQWANANVNNYPYLEVNPDVMDGNGQILPLPQRAQPPLAQTGLIQAKMGASDDIKATTGQYDSSIGATSNERSGKAILARERQGDVGTYHYGDNMAKAIRYATRQLIDLIPKIYDTERVVRIVGLDGTSDVAKLDPNQQEPIREVKDETGVVMEKFYNLSVGKYDVCATVGPSYMTKRQETREALIELSQNWPEFRTLCGDLIVDDMDFPKHREAAERLKRALPPEILSKDNPEVQKANQQIQQMGQEIDHLHTMLKNVSKSVEVQDQIRKDFEAQIKAYDAETKRIQTLQPNLSEKQVQDIMMGTLDGMIVTGDLMKKLGIETAEGVDQMEGENPQLEQQEGEQNGNAQLPVPGIGM